MQNYIDAQYQDILYFLRYAGIITLDRGVELPQIVTHTNVEAVINRFNQLIDDAAGLILKGISFDSQQLVDP